MATTIAFQLQAIKASIQREAEPTKRPFTRPSILFDPKEAADIDVETILSIALVGLADLIKLDTRFERYRTTIFTDKSRELDREMLGAEENKRIDISISSYLRLLAGCLHLRAAAKTVEYLIRRYKVHVYNIDELLLCALPYHDTHTFVRIVQLVKIGNNKWSFLKGVKASGAPPPRKVIVQQCIHDKGVLDAICSYAAPADKFHHSQQVVSLCTAVIVEMLGCMHTLDNDTVKEVVLPFVFNGLNPQLKGGSDHKAGALMIVSFLASRATLASKAIHNLIIFIANVAQQDANESGDLPWLHQSVMTIISLVQSQPIQLLPKKCLEALKEIRDLAGVLKGLSEEFKIERFLSVYLDTLVSYSSSDDSCRCALITAIETLPVKDFVANVVKKVLDACMKSSQKMENPNLHGSGSWAKEILVVFDKHYPTELRGAVRKFLEDPKMNSLAGDSNFRTLCLMLDGNLNFPTEMSFSKVWFSLEHPKAEIRRATLSALASSGLLDSKAIEPQNDVNIQEAILRRLQDDDLTVVQAVLSMDCLPKIIDPCRLLAALKDIVSRCTVIFVRSSSGISPQALDVSSSCIEHSVLNFKNCHIDFVKEVAPMVFSFLLIRPKTWRLNIKALDLVTQIKWSFFADLSGVHDFASNLQIKKCEPGLLTSINMKTIKVLTENFLTRPGEYMPWLIHCSSSYGLSKPLFLLVILQSFMLQNGDFSSLLALFQVCFPALKIEWSKIEGIVSVEEFSFEALDKVYGEVLDQLFNSNYDLDAVNSKILVCIFWSMLKAFARVSMDLTLVSYEDWLSMLQDLFVFSARSELKFAYENSLHLFVMTSGISPVRFLSKFFTENCFSVPIQVASLKSFATICLVFASSKRDGADFSDQIQLLCGFPSLLVPLSSDNQEIRVSTLNCIEGLYKLWYNIREAKCGNDIVLEPAFGEFMQLIINQRELVSSDVNLLPSFLTSVLGSCSRCLLTPENIDQRLDQSAKRCILDFIVSYSLNLSAYGKLRVLSLLKGMVDVIMHEEVMRLLSELLKRHNHYISGADESCEPLSSIEIDTLCLLLESCMSLSSSIKVGDTIITNIFEALQVDGASLKDPATSQPCVTVLKKLTSALYRSLTSDKQDLLFQDLVMLFRNDNGDIHNAAREALLRINVSFSTVVRLLDLVLAQECPLIAVPKRIKRRKQTDHKAFDLHHVLSNKEESLLPFLGSLLDMLLQKKDMEGRVSLVEPLFRLLEKIFRNKWLDGFIGKNKVGSEHSFDLSSIPGLACDIPQTILMILEEIAASLSSTCPTKDDVLAKFDVTLLVECARSTNEVETRNRVFLLLSSVSKIDPELVLDHIVEIFTVIGESAITQGDSHSQHVFEDLISTVVPCWLSKSNSAEKLLQIFVHVLPEVPEHRRLTLMLYILRTLGEKKSLGLLLVILFRTLAMRTRKCSSDTFHYPERHASMADREWEYAFAIKMCEQYSCAIWLPSLVRLLNEARVSCQHQEEKTTELILTFLFILHKLKDTELSFKLGVELDSDDIQGTLGELMEQVVSWLHFVTSVTKQLRTPTSIRKELKELLHSVLNTITSSMSPSAYFKATTSLLGHAEKDVRKKALGILCETLKSYDLVHKRKEKRKLLWMSTSGPHMDGTTLESFNAVCMEIINLVDDSSLRSNADTAVTQAAFSALEVLVNRFSSNNAIFLTCLKSVVKHICSSDLLVSSNCLRSTGALINVLGPKALPELPCIMDLTLKRAHAVSPCPAVKFGHDDNSGLVGLSSDKGSLLSSILVFLEAVVGKLGGFLNPYLENIIELLVLHSEYVSEFDLTMKSKADSVRRLVTDKIPVRLLLTPLLKIYNEAVKCGEASLSVAFEMLGSSVGSMDRSSVGFYHVRIFEQCLLALDLRHQQPVSISDIDTVEQIVIHVMIVLTMKLTETMFRPVFVRFLEWAEFGVDQSESSNKNLDRPISFFKLVNKLAEQHRSLFVPYFKYLLEACVRYLTDDQDPQSTGPTQKRKKAKVSRVESYIGTKRELSPDKWHLRALIMSSLHKCFLYDTGSLKFLDSSNFQVLLKPMVSQILVEPPAMLEKFRGIPSVNEVDDILVSCLGQMAVTAGSDLLWKPLNHEVLMQTRSGKVRSQILSLRVVKHLIEHLKEEYVVLLAETIPFLGELLEDFNLHVRTMAQDVIKELEILSGEDLKQYLR